ncbi:hypothetical protein [Streptacidiphilus fuscans]|uniref:Secreted protein n=1 Tax=Streptacidiphilus fuscans TaxID=2789292 RepID=A0A931B5L1_9ACTN|nr:hypothetical protein [Streptacidiphilus fuscans]MBF9069072.1 hypothetical protein [Streptacidiphilus fuscans]
MRILHGRAWAARLALVAALGLAPFGTTASASALPTTTGSVAPFAAQAKAAGLTAAQAASLQAQVGRILAKDGGHQVAANEIALPHGASVLLPLPGQMHARVLPGAVNLGFAPAGSTREGRTHPEGAVQPQDSISQWPQDGQAANWNGNWCYYGYFCAWTGEGASGAQFNVSQCNVDQELPGSGWDGTGSWFNNQTPGTQALLKDKNHSLVTLSAPPKSEDFDQNWGPIWYLDACQH